MATTESVLKDVLVNIAEELQYDPVTFEVKPVSSDGANYTSALFQATLTAPHKDDLSLFAKVAAVGEKMRNLANIFSTEMYFYKHLLKKYKSFEDRFEIPKEHRLVTPKFYGCNEEYLKEILVLEDLTLRGYQAFDRFSAIDWQYASQVVKQLAIFHALSLALSKYDPEEFEQTKGILKSDYDMKDSMEFMKTTMINTLEVVKEVNKEKLSKFVQNKMEGRCFDDFLEPMRCSMIVHGDFRPSNLMHRRNEDGSLEAIPLDFQMLRHASPVVDLVYFIFSGSDKEFRERHLTDTVELYYRELCNALRRFSIEPDHVYKREDFDYEYNKLLPLALIMSLCIVLLVTVEADKAPKVNEDLGLDTFAIKPNDLYAERINDIIEDFIAMGIL